MSLPQTFNINWKATIYPNVRGWRKIHALLANHYNLSEKETRAWMDKRTEDDGGYTEQLWCIVNELHPMFYNGQSYLENTTITLHPE